MRLKDHQMLYVRSMGKAFRVTAIFTDDDAANDFMAKNPGHAVMAVFGDVIFLAETNDLGTVIPRK